jgi:peptidoglycan/LPS O-acetylase OafA/YrhL
MSSAVTVTGALLDTSTREETLKLAESSRLTGKAPAKELYIPSLDGIRALAFLMVFVAHAGLYNLIPGGFGVTVFFFLSGYLITTLLRAEMERTDTISLKGFYLRRVFRILPPMYITLAIAYAIGTTGLLPLRGNLYGFVSVSAYFYNYADLLHKNVVLPSGTGVLWSLVVEEHFYLIFPFLYLFFIHRKFSVKRQVNILLVYCVAALIWRVALVYVFHTSTVSTTYPRWTYSGSEARFDAILFGCILAIRNNYSLGDLSPRLHRHKGLFAAMGLAVILVSFLVREPHFRETLRYTLQSVALYPIFYYCVASSSAWQVRWLSWMPLRYLGWISYSMYLSHYIFLEISTGLYPTHPVLDSVASFCLALIYSWLMRIWIELPSKHWRSSVQNYLAARA